MYKIAWLCDVQPPYREPVWRELGEISDLDVSIIFEQERVRHFVYRETPDYRSKLVPMLPVRLPGAVARHFDEEMALLKPGATRRMLRGADALIFHVWWQPANVQSAVHARLRGIPYIIYAESTMDSRRFDKGPASWFRSWMFRNAGAVLVPGPAAREAALRNGAAESRIVLANNSVDTDMIDRRMKELRHSEIPVTPHRFVCVGQLIERKNIASLLKAFADLDADATLDIAGDGVLMEELQAQARDLGIADRVTFHGFLQPDDMYALLGRTHTLVLPSTEEVYGFTALEAYAAGLQVISSSVAGVSATLAEQPGTWIAEPTVAALTEAMSDAVRSWTGWRPAGSAEFASARAAARDIVHAVEVAKGR